MSNEISTVVSLPCQTLIAPNLCRHRPRQHDPIMPSVLRLPSKITGVATSMRGSLPLWLGVSKRASRAPAAHLNSPLSTAASTEKPPRLPIPSLPDTLERYEASISALLPEGDHLDEEIRIIREFGAGLGPKLQEALIASDAAAAAKGSYPFSYIERIWDDAYLCARCPNPVNINPHYLLEPVAVAEKERGKEFAQAGALLHGIGTWWCEHGRSGES